VFHDRFEAAANRALAGDESMHAANKFKRVPTEDYPVDERQGRLPSVMAQKHAEALVLPRASASFRKRSSARVP
jgi:hypothetical protein